MGRTVGIAQFNTARIGGINLGRSCLELRFPLRLRSCFETTQSSVLLTSI
jgi:hypothetical protein